MRYQLSIIKCPNGRFTFVGSVPKDLVIRHKDGRTLSDLEFSKFKNASIPAMIARSEGYITPTFTTYSEALEFARENGVIVEGSIYEPSHR